MHCVNALFIYLFEKQKNKEFKLHVTLLLHVE